MAQLSTEARNVAANAVTALLADGFLRIYDGGSSPLAELRFGAPAFGAAASGVATANAIKRDAAARRKGTALRFRAFKSDGTTVVFEGTVGTSGADLILNSVDIQLSASVSVDALTYTQPAA